MALTNFKQTISWKNFSGKNCAGQIATFLMLIMVVVLIFILFTVNLGNISLVATSLDNAADSAALLLGSQLVARANDFITALNNTSVGGDYTPASIKGGVITDPQISWSTGILDKIFAILVIIVVVVLIALTPITFGSSTAAALLIIGGALGGGVGGLLNSLGDGSADWGVALNGAAVGAAMGFAVYGAVSLPALYAPGATTTTAGGAAGLVGDATGVILMDTAIGTTATTGGGLVTTGAVSLGVGIGISAGLSALATVHPIWQGMTGMKNQGATFKKVGNMLQGLSDYERYRENVFLTVLSRVVDDPRNTKDVYKEPFQADCNGDGYPEPQAGYDPCDEDGNGNIAEPIPYFQFWFGQRIRILRWIVMQIIQDLKGVVPGLADMIWFFKKSASDFKTAYSTTFYDDFSNPKSVVCAVLWRIDTSRNSHPDENYDFALYDAAIHKGDADPTGDELDVLRWKLMGWEDKLNGWLSRIKDSSGSYSYSKLAYTWQEWLPSFYNPPNSPPGNPGNEDDFYVVVNGRPGEFSGLKNLVEELKAAKHHLIGNKGCVFKQNSRGVWYISNPPCGLNEAPWLNFATIDSDIHDEFEDAVNNVNHLITQIETFRNQVLKPLYDDIQSLYRDTGIEQNPVTYYDYNPLGLRGIPRIPWVDKRGKHRVIVEVGSFQEAKIKYHDPHNSWLGMRKTYRYSLDGWHNSTWVKVTRDDEAYKETGSILGRWNPYSNWHDSEGDWTRVSRQSWVGYHTEYTNDAGTLVKPDVKLIEPPS